MKSTENFLVYGNEINPVVADISFEIHTIKWCMENRQDIRERPSTHNHFEIRWITKGQGNYWIDLKKCNIESNRVLFIRPGQVHFIKPTGELEGYIISFTDSFLNVEDQESASGYHNSLFQMFACTNGVPINDSTASDMKNIMEKMLKEFNATNLFRSEILRRYLKIFLIYITRHFEGDFKTTGRTRNIEIVETFMASLEKNFKKQKMVSDYAAILSVTPNYLNEIIKKTTGFSAGHHIRQRVALEAKKQAAYSGTCMKEIAYYLGFGDMAHFSKFFKNTTGINFTEFRKEKLVISAAASLPVN